MSFFDRLETLGVVRGNGQLAKCLDTPVGDFIVSDKLREVSELLSNIPHLDYCTRVLLFCVFVQLRKITPGHLILEFTV